MTSFDENYYCAGTNCQPTKNPDGQGFCAMTPFWCQRQTGLGGFRDNEQTREPTMRKPAKYCCSSGCDIVNMDYEKMGDNDKCTMNKLTCLYACKHNNAAGGFRMCDFNANASTNINIPSCPMANYDK